MRNRRINGKRASERAGFTMLHMMVVISVLPLLLVVATTWVHESMKMSNRFKHRRETNVMLNHFSNQFQNDVHGCKSSSLNSESNQVELTGHEGQQVIFQIEDGQINKTVTVDGEVVGRESFRLSDEYFAEWDTEVESDRVALKVLRYPTPLNRSAPESLDASDAKLELVVSAKANRWKQTVKFGRDSKTGGAE